MIDRFVQAKACPTTSGNTEKLRIPDIFDRTKFIPGLVDIAPPFPQ